jgi:hypothetical protein
MASDNQLRNGDLMPASNAVRSLAARFRIMIPVVGNGLLQ